MAAMDKKRVAAQLEDVPEKRRFRAEALDLFLAGDISGQRTQRLVNSAKLAGAQHVDDLARNEANPNASRDLLRKAMKASLWPKPYIASVPAFCPKTGDEKQVDVAMFLPHEMIAALLRVNEGMDILRLQEEELSNRRDIQEHLEAFKNEFRVDNVLALGLWVDGVPYSHDRTQSVECVTLNLPAISQHLADLRLPLLAFPKFFLQKGATWDSIFSILAWSFRCLLFGKWPLQRHCESPFLDSDSERRKMAGQDIGLLACLAELRGDWAMFKDTLHLPGWQGKGPICHKCNCTLTELHQVSMDAPWRLETTQEGTPA